MESAQWKNLNTPQYRTSQIMAGSTPSSCVFLLLEYRSSQQPTSCFPVRRGSSSFSAVLLDLEGLVTNIIAGMGCVYFSLAIGFKYCLLPE